MSKTIIVTGASKGIGLAITDYLLAHKHNLVLVARSQSVLEELKARSSGQVEIQCGDFADLGLGQKAVDLAISKFGKLDGIVLNHGTLGEVKRIADGSAEEWRKTFDVNFFSVVACVKSALPYLRETSGRIILTSSGAAMSAYSTWGAYGSSKAAMNHLAMTIKNEEPTITAIAIRPGMVDTEMQRELREVHQGTMDEKDHEKFMSATLLKPEQPGNVIARLVTIAPWTLSGQFLTWNDEALKDFQD